MQIKAKCDKQPQPKFQQDGTKVHFNEDRNMDDASCGIILHDSDVNESKHQPGMCSNKQSPPGGDKINEERDPGYRLTEKAIAEQLNALLNRPKDLATFLEELGLGKYLKVFEEEDVDLQLFLSMTDNDLKEVGIK